MQQEGPNGWDRRRTRVARSIERAALTLFARSSADLVTVEEICAAAGISKSTFFRYFTTRDEILGALPRRELETVAAHVRTRPPHESVVEAFIAATDASDRAEGDHDLALLWGIVVHREPEAAIKAMAHAAVDMTTSFQGAVAERLHLQVGDPRVVAVAAALAGVIGSTYRHWVATGGEGTTLSGALREALEAIALLHASDSGR